MLSQYLLRKYLSFARTTAYDAGKVLLKKSHRRHKITLKGRVDLVTDADLVSERLICGAIRRAYPDHAIIAEEGANYDIESEFRWVIDPLDGTTNFAHNFPFYCISIGLEYKGKIIVGVIFDPERDEMFSAFHGGGAKLNNKKITVSGETKLERSLLATGFPYDIGSSREDNLKQFRRFAKRARGIRRAGSAALDLCYLACGRFDGFWELKLHPWDTAAGMVMVKEAGGRVTDFKGNKYSIFDKYILATNAKIHRQMMEVLG